MSHLGVANDISDVKGLNTSALLFFMSQLQHRLNVEKKKVTQTFLYTQTVTDSTCGATVLIDFFWSRWIAEKVAANQDKGVH